MPIHRTPNTFILSYLYLNHVTKCGQVEYVICLCYPMGITCNVSMFYKVFVIIWPKVSGCSCGIGNIQEYACTVKPVCNDHLYNKMHYL